MADDFIEKFKKRVGYVEPVKAGASDESVPRVLDDEFAKLGYNSTARLSILGDVGRENAWRRDTIFGGHNDPKNNARNRGIISWQGDRRTNLDSYLKEQGVLGKGDDEELRAMARFMDKELRESFPNVHQKLRNAKSTYDASEALRQYIKYDPSEPYNSPDPEFRVKNNADWAKRARKLGLASDRQPMAAPAIDVRGELEKLLGPVGPGPTNPTNTPLKTGAVQPPQPVPTQSAPEQPPVPETIETLTAQRQAMHDPQSTRQAVLYTKGSAAPPKLESELDIPLANGDLLRSSRTGLQEYLAQTGGTVEDIQLGRLDFTPLIGGKAQPTNNTSGKITVVTRDAQGNELVSSTVETPDAIAKEAELQKKQFPNQPTQTNVTHGDKIAAERIIKQQPQNPVTPLNNMAQQQRVMADLREGEQPVDAILRQRQEDSDYGKWLTSMGYNDSNEARREYNHLLESNAAYTKEHYGEQATAEIGGRVGKSLEAPQSEQQPQQQVTYRNQPFAAKNEGEMLRGGAAWSGQIDLTQKPKGEDVGRYLVRRALENAGAEYGGFTQEEINTALDDLKKRTGDYIAGGSISEEELPAYIQSNGAAHAFTVRNSLVNRILARRNGKDDAYIAGFGDQLLEPQLAERIQMQNAQIDQSPEISNKPFGWERESVSEAKLTERIRQKDYAAQNIAGEAIGSLFTSPNGMLGLVGLAADTIQGNDIPVSDEWVKSEKDRLIKQHGNYTKAWEAEKYYQNADALETGVRLANQTARSFVKNLVGGTAKTALFVDNLVQSIPVLRESSASLRDIGNVADFAVRLLQSKDAAMDFYNNGWTGPDKDLIKQPLFKAVQEFENAIGDDPVLKGRLLGAGADATGSMLAFVALGAAAPSLRIRALVRPVGKTLGLDAAKAIAKADFGTAVSGAAQMAGSGYEEAYLAGVPEGKAKIYGVIQGLLGTTEMIGAGGEAAHFIKSPVMRSKFASALLEAAPTKAARAIWTGVKHEGKQEFGQEVFQTTSGNVVLEYLKDKDPSAIQKIKNVLNRIPKQLGNAMANEGLIALVTGGVMGGGTKAAQIAFSRSQALTEKETVEPGTPVVIDGIGSGVIVEDKGKNVVVDYTDEKTGRKGRKPVRKNTVMIEPVDVSGNEGTIDTSAPVDDVNISPRPISETQTSEQLTNETQTEIPQPAAPMDAEPVVSTEKVDQPKVERPKEPEKPKGPIKTQGIQISQRQPETTAERVFRGSETDELGKGDFAATFVSRDEKAASQYGKVRQYDLSANQKILDIDDPNVTSLVKEFDKQGGTVLDYDADDPANLFLFPDEKWVKFLQSKGYTASSIGSDLAIFDPSHLSFVDEQPAKKRLSNVQLELKKNESDAVDKFRRDMIDPADIAEKADLPSYAEDGLNIQPHITVKYGLKTNDVADLGDLFRGEEPITLTIGKTAVFPGAEKGPGYDVVIVEVDSPRLHELNKKIADNADVEPSAHPEYKPHITLAYVKKGMGEKYAGRTDLEGTKLTFDGVTFSPADKSGKIKIPLGGTADITQAFADAVDKDAINNLSPEELDQVAAIFDKKKPQQQEPWQMTQSFVSTKKAEDAFPIESKVEIRNEKPVYTYSTTVQYDGEPRTFSIEGRSQPAGSVMAERLHRKIIEQAIADGKQIPAEVLKDYPDLVQPETSGSAKSFEGSFEDYIEARRNAADGLPKADLSNQAHERVKNDPDFLPYPQKSLKAGDKYIHRKTGQEIYIFQPDTKRGGTTYAHTPNATFATGDITLLGFNEKYRKAEDAAMPEALTQDEKDALVVIGMKEPMPSHLEATLTSLKARKLLKNDNDLTMDGFKISSHLVNGDSLPSDLAKLVTRTTQDNSNKWFAKNEQAQKNKAEAANAQPVAAPETVKEDHAVFFKSQDRLVPIDKLIDPTGMNATDAEPQRAIGYMRDIAAGKPGSKGPRDPITVKDNDNGTYTIIDGKSTYVAAKEFGWETLPVQIADELPTRAVFPNSLNIKREDMPQIRESDQAAFIEFAKTSRNVAVEPDTIAVKDLLPTQIEYNPRNAAGIPADKLDKRLIVSADNRLLDGHNTLVRLREIDPNRKINILRIRLMADEAIELMKAFPKATFKSVKDVGRQSEADGLVARFKKVEKDPGRATGRIAGLAYQVRDHAETLKDEYWKDVQDVAATIPGATVPGEIKEFLVKTEESLNKKLAIKADKVPSDLLRTTILLPTGTPERTTMLAAFVLDGMAKRGYTLFADASTESGADVTNRFEDPTPGYKDINLKFVKDGDPVVRELQLIQPEMFAAKNIGHKAYDTQKDIKDVIRNATQLSAEQKAILEKRFEELDREMAAMYLAAYTEDTKAGSEYPSATPTASMAEPISIIASQPSKGRFALDSKPSMNEAKDLLSVLSSTHLSAARMSSTDMAANFFEVSANIDSSNPSVAPKAEVKQENTKSATTPTGSSLIRASLEKLRKKQEADRKKNDDDDAFGDLDDLLGLRSGIVLEEQPFYQSQYEKYKPALTKAIASVTGETLEERVDAFIQKLNERYPIEALEKLEPYLARFVDEFVLPNAQKESIEEVDAVDATKSDADGQRSDAGESPADVQGTDSERESRSGGSGTRSGSTSNTLDTEESGNEPGGDLESTGDRPDEGSVSDGPRSTSESDRPSNRIPVERKPARRDYIAPYGSLEREGSWTTAAKNNLDAIELLKKIESENRVATREEQEVLVKFVGWGASEIANNIFKDPDSFALRDKPAWRELAERLNALMTPDEIKTASRSTQYAHYTSEKVIRGIWNAIEQFGFSKGSILEPGMGNGLFAIAAPQNLIFNSGYTGIEMDSLTARIAKQLLPDQSVLEADFIKQKLPWNHFDVAIGNPPFADIKIMADPKYKKHRFLLHDYFFAKSLDAVRPGGLLAFVTSKGTMDKIDAKAREYMAAQADLLGAIRLPQTAFKQNAGTEVVTDVLFFRKRMPGEEPGGEQWLGHGEVTAKNEDGNDQTGLVNEYYLKHPEMVLGEHSFTGSMRQRNQYTVIPRDGDIEEHFLEAVKALPTAVYAQQAKTTEIVKAAAKEDWNPKAQKEGSLYLHDDGTLMVREGGRGVNLASTKKLTDKDEKWLKDYIGLRQALKQAQYDQLNAENENTDWEKSLANLNKVYDAFVKKHGNILAFTDRETTKKDPATKKPLLDEDGNPVTSISRSFKNERLLSNDVEGPLVWTLEKITDDGDIIKSNWLKERQIKPPSPPKIENLNDALMVSLDTIGRLNIPHIAELIAPVKQMTEDEIIAELDDLIYEEPGGGWVMAEEYLSGNVKAKLEVAMAAASDPRFKRNVEALHKVQPLPLPAEKITIQIGATWVPADVVSQFATEVLGVKGVRQKHPERYWEKITGPAVEFNAATGKWTVPAAHGSGSQAQRSATAEWGTDRRSPAEVLEAALNSETPVIKSVDPGPPRTERVDKAAMEAVQDKIKRMNQAFKPWLMSDPERATALVDLYNEKMNVMAEREFDGRHLTTPGLSLRFKLHPHVKRAIWRIIQTGNTYLAHAVGAGKTLEMIVSAMEQKRLGLINKPMFVVPNHMLKQFSSEFLEAYPLANIMVADEQNFHTDNRRRFVAQAALNDLDAVIITHSAFGLLRNTEESSKAVLDDLLAEMHDAMEALTTGTDNKGNPVGDSIQDTATIKQINNRIEKIEQKFYGRMNSERDNVLDFEEMGVDFLYVDEAHEFRKLDFVTSRKNLKGIDPSGSMRALDLLVKSRWLDKQRPGRSMVLASGTPITNTMAELFSIQRFLGHKALTDDGLDTFDGWAKQFGESETNIEANAAGGYKEVERFSKFVNTGVLMQRVRAFMDVITLSQLQDLIKVPTLKINSKGKAAPEVVVTERTEALEAYLKGVLARRIEESENWKPSFQQKYNPDPMIAIISDGQHAAFDMRFIDPSLPNEPDSKLNRMIDGVLDSYHAYNDLEYINRATGEPYPIKGAAHIVFSYGGFGEQVAKNRGFDAKKWMRQRLVEGGIPAREIAFITDYKTSTAKEMLFKEVREGKVKVLVGSPKNMGTGVNAQLRLKTLHYGMAPWYPADIEQPHGRIIRHGNQNDEVELYWYAAKGTYDEAQWGMLARKSKAIEDAMTGHYDGDVEDVSESSQYAMASALASGDPRALRLAELRGVVEKYNRLEQAHYSSQRSLDKDRQYLESEFYYDSIPQTETRIKELENALSLAPKERISKENFVIKVGKDTFDKDSDKNNAEIGTAVKEAWKAAIKREKKSIIASQSRGVTTEIATVLSKFPLEVKAWEGRTGIVTNARITIGDYKVTLTDNNINDTQIDDISESGLISRIYNAVNGIEEKKAQAETELEQRKTRLADIITALQKPFEFKQEAADARAEMSQLTLEMTNAGLNLPPDVTKNELAAIQAMRNVIQGRIAKQFDDAMFGDEPSLKSALRTESLETWEGTQENVAVHTNTAALTHHPDYDAAKAGDRRAAVRVVKDLVKANITAELVRQYPDAIVVPVREKESTGHNKLPAMYASHLAKQGLERNRTIYSAATVNRKSLEGFARLGTRKRYRGKVEPGRNYILVDDVFTHGGTLNDLRLYIESNGGKVVAVTSLAPGRLGKRFVPTAETRTAVKEKFDDRELDGILEEYGIPAASDLTEHELRLIAGQSGIDGIRRQLDAAGISRRRGLGGKSVREDRLRSTLGNRKLTDQDAETDRMTVEEMKLLPYVGLDELLPKASVDVVNGNIKANAASHELFRRTLEQIRINKGSLKVGSQKYEDLFTGLFQRPGETQEMIDTLKAKRDEAGRAGYTTPELKVFDDHIAALETSAEANGGTSIIYILDKALPHEMFHNADYLGAVNKALMQRHSDLAAKELDAHKVTEILAEKHFAKFNQYRQLAAGMRRAWIRSEIPPYLLELSEQELADQYGITPDMAADYLLKWFEGYAEKNGIEALDHFNKDEINVQQFLKQVRESYAGTVTNGNARGANEADNQRQETDSGGKARADQTGDTRGPTAQGIEVDGKEWKLRSLPQTLRAAGLNAIDEAYQVYHDYAAVSDAADLFEKWGIAGERLTSDDPDAKYNDAIELLRDLPAKQQDAQHALLSFMLIRTLADHAYQATDPAEAARARDLSYQLAQEHAEKATQAGRFTRMPSVIGPTLEHLIYQVQGVVAMKYGQGKTLSDQEREKWESLGRQIEEAQATITRLKMDKRNQAAQIKRLKDEQEGKKRKRSKGSARSRAKLVQLVKDEKQKTVDAIRERLRAQYNAEPVQMSAIGNNGNFDENEPSILKSAVPDDFPIDDFAEVGAMMLIEGIAGERDYLPHDFEAEMIAEFGDVVRPHFHEIYKAAWNRRNEWLDQIRYEQTKERIEAKYNEGEELEDWQVEEILGEEKAKAKRRRAIESVHKMAAGGKSARRGVEDMKRIVADMAPDDNTAIGAMLLNDGISANEIYRRLQDYGITDEKTQREILRNGKELLEQAKIEYRAEQDQIANEILDAERELKRIDQLRWEARNELNRTQRTVNDEMRRLRDGELSYRAGQIVEVTQAMRTMMASFDMSGAFRQGGWFSIAAPELQKQAFANMFKSLTEDGYGGAIQGIEENPLFTLMLRSGIDFAIAGKGEAANLSGEELFRGEQMIEKIPLLGWLAAEGIVKPSERTYTAFLDTQRSVMAEAMFRDLLDRGLTYQKNKPEFEAVAKFVNVATGRGVMPSSKFAKLLMELPLFAPRYALSRLQLLNMTLNPVAYYNMPPVARRTVAKSALRFYGTVSVVMGIAAALGAQVSLDPDDDDFLKIKVGNARYDLFAGTLQPMKMLVKILTSAYRTNLGTANRMPGEFGWDVLNATGRFVRGKFSPPASLITDALLGSDYVGNKFDAGNYKDWLKGVGSRLIPLTVSDVLQSYTSEGITGPIKTLPFAWFGIGVGNYKDRPEQPTTDAEKLAAKMSAWNFKGTSKLEKEQRELVADLTARSRKGEDVATEIGSAMQKGMFSDYHRRQIEAAASKSLLEDKAEGLPLDQLWEVLKVATSSEREQLMPLVNRKMKNADVDGSLRPELRKQLESLGGRVAGDFPMPDDVADEFRKFRIKTPDVGESLTLKRGQDAVKLTPEQYDKYRRETLERIYQKLSEVVSRDDYLTAPYDKQREMIERTIRKARQKEQKETKRDLSKERQ